MRRQPVMKYVSANRRSSPTLVDGNLVAEKRYIKSIRKCPGRASFSRQCCGKRKTTRSVPAWLSILPPLLAIVIALLFKRVIPALFLGIWVGGWIAIDLSFFGLGKGLLDGFQVYVREALADGDHASIILFTLMVGGNGRHHIQKWRDERHSQSNCRLGEIRQTGTARYLGVRFSDFFRRLCEYARSRKNHAPGYRPSPGFQRKTGIHRRLNGSACGPVSHWQPHGLDMRSG